MRNRALHALLEAFTSDAAGQLRADAAGGAEVPFEVVESRGAAAPLYCYRPLTEEFIGERAGKLSALTTYTPAVRALAGLEGLDDYLRHREEPRKPRDPRARADAVLRAFLSAVFAERSEFGFERQRFEVAYGELERVLYEGRRVSTVIAPLLGIALDPHTTEVPLSEGLSLVRGDILDDAPPEAVWGDGEEPNVLALLTVTRKRGVGSAVPAARKRFRRILTALRLFERGGYALGPLAWSRTDDGPWRAVSFGGSGRPRFTTVISTNQEDELRAFYNLLERGRPGRAQAESAARGPRAPGGEIAWALSRFEMGSERLAPFEALTDYLLALRALLEPEGPGSGRLAMRLAAICAKAEDRAPVAERIAHAISLERAVIAGLAPAKPGVDALVEEIADHLRALLRDVICGHLDSDLRKLADGLLAERTAVTAVSL